MATAPLKSASAVKESIYAWEGKDKTGKIVRERIEDLYGVLGKDVFDEDGWPLLVEDVGQCD